MYITPPCHTTSQPEPRKESDQLPKTEASLKLSSQGGVATTPWLPLAISVSGGSACPLPPSPDSRKLS